MKPPPDTKSFRTGASWPHAMSLWACDTLTCSPVAKVRPPVAAEAVSRGPVCTKAPVAPPLKCVPGAVAATAIAPKTKAREAAAKIGSDPTVVRLLWEFVGVMMERTGEGSWGFANYQGRS